MKKYIPWALTLYVVFVFIQSLFFKFTGSEETVIIFSTIGAWMSNIGLPDFIAGNFTVHGGIAIGLVELIASGLILIPKTRIFGAALAFFVINGAIFFHLFTPLGIVRVIDAAGNTDGGVLFYMACGVWASCLGLFYLYYTGRKQVSTWS
jgi:hypothetical protein